MLSNVETVARTHPRASLVYKCTPHRVDETTTHVPPPLVFDIHHNNMLRQHFFAAILMIFSGTQALPTSGSETTSIDSNVTDLFSTREASDFRCVYMTYDIKWQGLYTHICVPWEECRTFHYPSLPSPQLPPSAVHQPSLHRIRRKTLLHHLESFQALTDRFNDSRHERSGRYDYGLRRQNLLLRPRLGGWNVSALRVSAPSGLNYNILSTITLPACESMEVLH